MKKTAVLILAMIAGFILITPFLKAEGNEHIAVTKIQMVFNDHKVIVELFDNPASRDFISLLPFTGNFEDFAGAEKISYLPRKLNTEGSPTAKQARGDFTYYAPWGNLAVFYKGSGTDGNLYVLGKILSGKEHLGKMNRNFTATIEKID